MPSATFSHTAVVNVPRAEVWVALDDPETWNSITGVDRVHEAVIDSGGRLQGFLFDTTVGGSVYEGRATPRAREDERVMSWNIENSQLKGHITVSLGDTSSATELTVSIQMASASFLAGMFFGAISAVIGDGLPATVETLARAVEARRGEPGAGDAGT